jgi:hypothetical protein
VTPAFVRKGLCERSLALTKGGYSQLIVFKGAHEIAALSFGYFCRDKSDKSLAAIERPAHCLNQDF